MGRSNQTTREAGIQSLVACFIMALVISAAYPGVSASEVRVSGSFVGKEGGGVDSDWLITLPDAAGEGGLCEDRNGHRGVGKGTSCQVTDVKFDGKTLSFAVSKAETLALKVSRDGSQLKGKITRTLPGGKTSSGKVKLTRVKSSQAALAKADAMDKAEVRRQELARIRAENASTIAAAFSGLAAGLSGNTGAVTTGGATGTAALLQQSSQRMLEAAQAQAAAAEQERKERERVARERAEVEARERRRLEAARQQFMAQERHNAELRRTQQMLREQQQEQRRQQELAQQRRLEQQRLEQQRKQEQQRRLAEQRRQQQQLEQQRRQQQLQTSARSQAPSLPPNCVSTSLGQSGPNYVVRAVNHCGQAVNVNVCAKLPGRSFPTDKKSAQLGSGQSRAFSFFEPNKKGFQYRYAYCAPGTTTARTNCPAGCP